MNSKNIRGLVAFAVYGVILFLMLNGITMMLDFFGYSVTIPVMVLMCGLAAYFLIKPARHLPFFFILIAITYLLYLAISLVSLYLYRQTYERIDVPYLARSVMYNVVIMYVIYRFVLNRMQCAKFTQLANVLFFAMAIGCLLTLYSGLFGFYTIETKNFAEDPTKIIEERLAGVYINPNLAGFVANLGLILSLTLLLGKSVGRKLVGIAGMALSIAAAVGSFSKTSFLQSAIILIVFIGMYFFSYSKIATKTRRHVNVILLVIVFLFTQISVYVAAAFDELTPQQQERIEQLSTLVSSGKLNSDITSLRSDAVADGFRKIAEHPLMGNGFASFMRLKVASERVGEDIGVHNTFLLVLGDAGILPFMLYLLFYVFCFISFLRISDIQVRYFAIMLLLSTAFFNTTNHEALIHPLQAVIMGILCAVATYSYWPKSSKEAMDETISKIDIT